MKVTDGHMKVLCEIAAQAGREVMAVYEHGGMAWEKQDTSPLTEADLRADTLIRERLESMFPGVFILSEESQSQGAPPTETFFLVDPLDGTKEFLKRNGEFTVNIALVHAGSPVAGVVFAPAFDEMFFTAKNRRAWHRAGGRDRQLSVSPSAPGQLLRVVGSRSHGSDALDRWLAALPCEYTFRSVGSSLKFCRIADGTADVYPRLGPTSQWDTAAAQAVLEAAGGQVVDASGASLRYGLDRPVLNPDFLAVADPVLLTRCSSGEPRTR